MVEVNVFLAFGAGVLSFISPCVLPLFPVFLSYITGMSVSEIQSDHKTLTKNSLTHTVIFLLGFSVIFIILGFSMNFVSQFFEANKSFIRQIGAIVIIFFGLVVIGFFNFEFLMKDRKVTFKNRPTGYIGSFLIGMAFSMGWTPCMGPILASVIVLASQYPEQGALLMTSYVLGFSIPFIVLAFFLGKLNIIKKHSVRLMKVGGYVMIFFGVMLFFDWMTKLTSRLAEWTGFYGF